MALHRRILSSLAPEGNISSNNPSIGLASKKFQGKQEEARN